MHKTAAGLGINIQSINRRPGLGFVFMIRAEAFSGFEVSKSCLMSKTPHMTDSSFSNTNYNRKDHMALTIRGSPRSGGSFLTCQCSRDEELVF